MYQKTSVLPGNVGIHDVNSWNKQIRRSLTSKVHNVNDFFLFDKRGA